MELIGLGIKKLTEMKTRNKGRRLSVLIWAVKEGDAQQAK